MYILALEGTKKLIHLFQIAQIATMLWDKAFIKISIKYFDYTNFLLSDRAIELLKNRDINKYVIKLINRKQSLYWPIYVFYLIELEILKSYIINHLKSRFIQSFKYLTNILIFFDKRLNSNRYLYINY